LGWRLARSFDALTSAFGRRLLPIAVALSLSFAIAAPVAAQSDPVQDEFSTSSEPGGGSTSGLPGEVGGGPCEDTSKYDRVYGGPPVRIALPALHNELYQRHPDILARCAVDRCAVNETAICWINRAALAEARNEPPVADEFETGGEDPYADQYETGSDDGSGGYDSGGYDGGGNGGDSYDTAGNQPPPDGSKSIFRDSEPIPNPQASAAARKLVSAMDDCLKRREELTYYRSPRLLERAGPVEYDAHKGSLRFDANALAGEDPYMRAFDLGDAVAQHLLALERARYGDQRSAADEALAGDFILGYLTHCVEERHLIPPATNADDPRPKFTAWMLNRLSPVGSDPIEERRHAFDSGWASLGMRMPDWLAH